MSDLRERAERYVEDQPFALEEREIGTTDIVAAYLDGAEAERERMRGAIKLLREFAAETALESDVVSALVERKANLFMLRGQTTTWDQAYKEARESPPWDADAIMA